MKMTIVFVILGLVALSSSAFGFDGKRKGFVIGGGLGIAPALEELKLRNSIDESPIGIGMNSLIGYAWDEHNMIVSESNTAIAIYETTSGYTGHLDGFNGPIWYHYFGEVGKSYFTTLGLQPSVSELGLLLGGGYEFSRHWQIGGYLSFWDSDFYGEKSKQFTILLSGVAF